MLDALREGGQLDPLALHFATAMGRLAEEQRPEVLLAAALVSHQVSQGHVCLELSQLAALARLLPAPAGQRDWPEAQEWLAALRSSPLVGDAGAVTPLVLDEHNRLYLRRYWQHQSALEQAIRRRSIEVVEQIDGGVLAKGLERLFPSVEIGRAHV